MPRDAQVSVDVGGASPSGRPKIPNVVDVLPATSNGHDEENSVRRQTSRRLREKNVNNLRMTGWGGGDDVGEDEVKVNSTRMSDDPAITMFAGDDGILSGSSRWSGLKSHVKTMGLLELGRQENVKNFGERVAADTDFTSKEYADQEVPEVKRLLYINPDGNFRTYWDVFQVLVLFYLAWVTPYRVAFDAAAYGYEFYFEFLVDVYFVVDVFLNFVTGYWKDLEVTSVLIHEPWAIAKNYMATWWGRCAHCAAQ